MVGGGTIKAMNASTFHRRRFLKSVALSAAGVTLPSLLRFESRARASGRPSGAPKSLLFLFLYGGPSQIDTWDMKPNAPADFRGEFQPAPTAVPGWQMVEYLPRMAQMTPHYSLIRTLNHV